MVGGHMSVEDSHYTHSHVSDFGKTRITCLLLISKLVLATILSGHSLREGPQCEKGPKFG